jgi:hypothetical protein
VRRNVIDSDGGGDTKPLEGCMVNILSKTIVILMRQIDSGNNYPEVQFSNIAV